MKKVKVHKFWIPAESSVGTSRYKLFVAKADYDRVIKRLKEIEDYVRNQSEDTFWTQYLEARH